MDAGKAGLQSVLDPQWHWLASQYAEAALALAAEDEQAEETACRLESLAAVIDEIPGARELFSSELLVRQERLRLAERLFVGRVGENIESLLMTMAANGRLSILKLVARRFRELLNARQGKVEVTVTTAVPLDDDHRGRVRDSLSELLEAPVLLKTRVDAAIVGGMVVRVGDRVFDASVAGGIERIRGKLLEAATERPMRKESHSNAV